MSIEIRCDRQGCREILESGDSIYCESCYDEMSQQLNEAKETIKDLRREIALCEEEIQRLENQTEAEHE